MKYAVPQQVVTAAKHAERRIKPTIPVAPIVTESDNEHFFLVSSGIIAGRTMMFALTAVELDEDKNNPTL